MKSRFLMLIGILALGGCLSTTAPTPSDPATETFASSLGVNIDSMTKTPSGTYFQDLVSGTGTTLNVLATDSVRVDYEAYLKNGFEFAADTNAIVPLQGSIYGFVDGIHGMNIGGQRLIVIPSNLGYGANFSDLIPANATLIYKVKLRNIYLTPSAPTN